MLCINCNAETNNPKFCSRSCVAIYNNKTIPKRQPTGTCKDCDVKIPASHKRCKHCDSQFKRDFIASLRAPLVANATGETKKCSCCHQVLPNTIQFFYYNKVKQLPHSKCKQCLRKHFNDKKRKIKLALITLKGGKCLLCGYNRCLRALEFHHTLPEHKDFNIATTKNRVTTQILTELEKCVLVCSNCHRELHENLVALVGDDPTPLD